MADDSGYQLAELNIAKMRFAPDDPRMREFVEALDPVNGAADTSPGFVWRLQSEDGDAMAFQLGDDASLLVNLSVWESLDALRAFYLAAPHSAFLRRRGEWFERAQEPYMALWWVPVGHRPDLEEAAEKLAHIRRVGATREVFDFANLFPKPSPESAEDTQVPGRKTA